VPVPQEVIADLPKRIERLPVTSSMSGPEFLEILGLSNFVGNVSGSVRFYLRAKKVPET
jgi:hypothetical protein